MVFGTTYCAISHLPIEDGDKCILLPLGFDMKYSFDQYNKADINSFLYLYTFIYQPQEVIYEGNPNMIKYLDESYANLQYELYMLVHYKFYHSIQKEYLTEREWKMSQLPNFKTCTDIWKQAQEIATNNRERISELIKKSTDDSEKQKLSKEFMDGGDCPSWMIELFKFAMILMFQTIISGITKQRN